MKRKTFIIFFMIFYCCAVELFYTVDFCPATKTLFYACQEGLDSLTLYSYDFSMQEHTQLLSRFYTPTAFRLLPNNDGFSFIQHDAIYIKYFNKRSPKRIEFYEPIYGINTIEWLDNKMFYFAAREHGNYNIYKADIEGNIILLLHEEDFDLLYPQIKTNLLFYIARTIHNKYHIKVYNFDTNKKVILHSSLHSLACLSIICQGQGFFLSYEPKILKDNYLMQFGYYTIKKEGNKWCTTKLFSFNVPSIYLGQSSQRIYESIIPFLPRYFNEIIYCVDYETEDKICLKKYFLENYAISDAKIIGNPLFPGVFLKENFLEKFENSYQ